jgi:O-antigen/teichoic acid export membrane protein
MAKGAFWSFAGSLISRGLGLLATIAVARILGKSGFGHLGMVQSTVGIFGSLAGFGLGLTALKHVAEFRSTNPERAGRIIGLSSAFSWLTSGVMSVVLVALAPWLAQRTLAAPEMSGMLRAGSLLLLLGGVNGAQTGVLAGFEAFKTIARINVITGLISFPVTFLGAWQWGVMGAVWALVVNLAINCALNFIAVRKEADRAGVVLSCRGCLQELPLLWNYSLPAMMGGALASPASWIAGAILVNQPDGYAQMGIYNAVLRIKMVPEQVLVILLTPLLPVLSETLGRRDLARFQKTSSAAFALSLLATAPFALVQIALPLLTLLPYGRAYAGQFSVVQWVMLDLAVIGLFTPFGSIINSAGRMWFSFWYQLFWGLLCCACSVLLIPRFGATGLAAAMAISRAVMVAASLLYLSHWDRELLCGMPLARMGLMVSATALTCFFAGRCGSIWVGICGSLLALLPLLLVKDQLLRFRALMPSRRPEVV